MKKKIAVLVALISIYLIGMSGIVAVSASDEPTADVTLSKINPDGTTTLVKTGNTSIIATSDENGTVNIEVDGSNTTTVDSLKPSESNENIKRISVMVDIISGMIYAGEYQLILAGVTHPEGYQRQHPESEPTIPVKVDFVNKTIDAGGKQLKLIEIKEIRREDIIAEKGHGKVSISGQLDSGEGRAYGSWYFAEGYELFVEIDLSPSDVDVLLAVVDMGWSGEGIIDRDHDGYACFDYTIPEGGDYYIIVGAPDGGFDYERWLHWYWE